MNVTRKETVRYLKSYRLSCAKIDQREKELAEWEGRYQKNLSFGVLMPMSLLMCKIKAEVEQAVRARDQVAEDIGEMKDGTIQQVMERRYLAGQSFEDIAKSMGYCVSYIFELHRKGLIEIAHKKS